MRGLASITIYQQQEINSLCWSLVNQEQALMGWLEAINVHVARLARETTMQRAQPRPVAQRRLQDAERRRQQFLGSDSDGPVAGPSTGPGMLTGAGMEANPHLLVEIESEEEDQGEEVETVRRVMVLPPPRGLLLPYPALPEYESVEREVTISEAAATFEAIAEDAAREEEDEGERTATEEDLYATTE